MSTLDRTDTVVAYDYEAQRWITGDAALALLELQADETAALLASDPDFRAFIGLKSVDGDDNG